jgi:predicted transcriptional regulator
MAHQTPKLTNDQKQLIERLGVMFERGGLAPAPARVNALLLVSPEVELPFDDITAMLQLSKSATSNAINQLTTMGKIEYVTRPGERKRYFRSRVKSWKEDMLKQIQGLGAMSAIFNEVLKGRPKQTVEFNRSLKEVSVFIDHLIEELPIVMAKWDKKA